CLKKEQMVVSAIASTPQSLAKTQQLSCHFIDDENNVPGDTPSKLSVDGKWKTCLHGFLNFNGISTTHP
ncbi:hypothetical protein, partial [Shigella boydii]|uniref:hypothetical protein n=1 Tax=Shigella boydii TaxID=621 RepID=UPI001F3DE9F8